MTAEPEHTHAPKVVTSAAAPARAPSDILRSKRQRSSKSLATDLVRVRIHGVFLAVLAGDPVVCVEMDAPAGAERLPVADFIASRHRDLEQPLVEKLLAGAKSELVSFRLLDCRLVEADAGAEPTIEITYLGLVGPVMAERSTAVTSQAAKERAPIRWQSLYMKLPWEDWRHGRPSLLDSVVLPHLAQSTPQPARGARKRRGAAQAHRTLVDTLFPRDEAAWDVTLASERYDLLAAAGVLPDAVVSGQSTQQRDADARLGTVMAPGDRQRLALALGRLRTDVKDRPNVKPLMPPEFTLFELQRCVEAVLGPALHKQNFRRQLEAQGLLEPVGRYKSNTGGRPAQLYRFVRKTG